MRTGPSAAAFLASNLPPRKRREGVRGTLPPGKRKTSVELNKKGYAERTCGFRSPLIAGASANNATAVGGAFAWNVNNAPSNANWNNGCGLSYLKRTAFKEDGKTLFNALYDPHPLVKIARQRAGIVGGRCRMKFR